MLSLLWLWRNVSAWWVLRKKGFRFPNGIPRKETTPIKVYNNATDWEVVEEIPRYRPSLWDRFRDYFRGPPGPTGAKGDCCNCSCRNGSATK